MSITLISQEVLINGKVREWPYWAVTKGIGKVFYGQDPPSGESTTTECGFNYQLLAVIYRSSPMGSS